MSDLRAALAESPVFAGAAKERLTRAAAAAQRRSLASGERIFAAGDPASHVFVLLEGVVRLFLREDTRELTINHLVPPCTFGEVEVVAETIGDERPGYLVHAQAQGAVELAQIPAEAFIALVREDGAFSYALLRDVCARFRNTASRERAAFFDVPTRLAAFLLTQLDLAGRATPHGIEIRHALTQEDLANGLGVTVRSIARALADLGKQKVLSRRKGWWVVHDRAALETLCGGARMRLVYKLDWPRS